MLTVMKFGGTSVGSPEAIERVAKIIAGTEGRRAVVVSAMSGITNFLVGVCENVPELRDETLKAFEEKHLAVARALFKGERLDKFMAEFTPRLENPAPSSTTTTPA